MKENHTCFTRRRALKAIGMTAGGIQSIQTAGAKPDMVRHAVDFIVNHHGDIHSDVVTQEVDAPMPYHQSDDIVSIPPGSGLTPEDFPKEELANLNSIGNNEVYSLTLSYDEPTFRPTRSMMIDSLYRLPEPQITRNGLDVKISINGGTVVVPPNETKSIQLGEVDVTAIACNWSHGSLVDRPDIPKRKRSIDYQRYKREVALIPEIHIKNFGEVEFRKGLPTSSA